MDMLVWLIPISLSLGGIGLIAFFWTMKTHQYEDPEGARHRILSSDFDDAPKPHPSGP